MTHLKQYPILPSNPWPIDPLSAPLQRVKVSAAAGTCQWHAIVVQGKRQQEDVMRLNWWYVQALVSASSRGWRGQSPVTARCYFLQQHLLLLLLLLLVLLVVVASWIRRSQRLKHLKTTCRHRRPTYVIIGLQLHYAILCLIIIHNCSYNCAHIF